MFFLGITHASSQYVFSGQVSKASKNKTVYLSLVENYRKSARVYADQILKETQADGEEWGLQILRVPTFIFYKNGKEQHRIIESPNRSLELDMLQITTTTNYIAHKAQSMHFD